MIDRLRHPYAGALASGLLFTLILGYMVVDRVRLIKGGQEIVLPIRPVDPRDLFKGDFVRLGFDISRVDRKLLPVDVVNAKRETVVYVTIERDAADKWQPVAVATALSSKVAPNQIVIQGRSNRYVPEAIRYGLERYYLPEGTGGRIEDMARKSQISAIVAVDAKGRAAIKGLVQDGKRIYDEPLL